MIEIKKINKGILLLHKMRKYSMDNGFEFTALGIDGTNIYFRIIGELPPYSDWKLLNEVKLAEIKVYLMPLYGNPVVLPKEIDETPIAI